MKLSREDIHCAASVPQVPYWASLISILVLTKPLKLIPEEYWDRLISLLDRCDLDRRDGEEIGGWTFRSNHVRSEYHENWSMRLAESFRDQDEVWFIPVSELLALRYNEFDGVSICRLFFVGNKQEMTRSLLGLGLALEDIARTTKLIDLQKVADLKAIVKATRQAQ